MHSHRLEYAINKYKATNSQNVCLIETSLNAFLKTVVDILELDPHQEPSTGVGNEASIGSMERERESMEKFTTAKKSLIVNLRAQWDEFFVLIIE